MAVRLLFVIATAMAACGTVTTVETQRERQDLCRTTGHCKGSLAEIRLAVARDRVQSEGHNAVGPSALGTPVNVAPPGHPPAIPPTTIRPSTPSGIQIPAGGHTAESEAVFADPSIAQNAAFTQPARSWTYDSRLRFDSLLGYSPYAFGDFFTNGLTHGFTDAVQGTFRFQPLLYDNSFVRVTTEVKARVRIGPLFWLSTEVGFSLLRLFHGPITSDDHEWIKSPSATLVGTACLSQECASHFSAHSRYVTFFSGRGSASHNLHYGASLRQRVAAHVKLQLELEAASYKGRGGFRKFPGFAVTYGLRFFGQQLAADIGLTKPIADGQDDPVRLGLPSAALSYRWR